MISTCLPSRAVSGHHERTAVSVDMTVTVRLRPPEPPLQVGFSHYQNLILFALFFTTNIHEHSESTPDSNLVPLKFLTLKKPITESETRKLLKGMKEDNYILHFLHKLFVKIGKKIILALVGKP